MAGLLDRYKSAVIRHPSWRIYSAMKEIQNRSSDLLKKKIITEDDLEDLSVGYFGLKEGIEVYIPVEAKEDEMTNVIIEALIDKDYEDKTYCIEECLRLFCDVRARQMLEGALMNGSIPADIAGDYGYDLHIIETYAAVLYDTSVWRTPADKLKYIEKGTCGEDARIKSSIRYKGLDYVATHEFNYPSKVKMEEALANLFGRSYEQALLNISSNEVEDAKVSQDWVKRSIEIFKELKNASRADGGIKELTIALQTSSAPKKGVADLVDK